MNPWKYSAELRAQMVDWLANRASKDEVLKIASQIAPGYETLENDSDGTEVVPVSAESGRIVTD